MPVEQLGAAVVQAPQSSTVSCIWPRSVAEPVALAVLSTKSPASEPVFVMSTVELPVSPGFMPVRLSSAVLGELRDDEGAGAEGVAGIGGRSGEVRAGSNGDANGGEDDGERAKGTARMRRQTMQTGHRGFLQGRDG